jgi:CBS domain containing-hemolysin-like protein
MEIYNIFLILLNGVFSMSEIALISARKRLESSAKGIKVLKCSIWLIHQKIPVDGSN